MRLRYCLRCAQQLALDEASCRHCGIAFDGARTEELLTLASHVLTLSRHVLPRYENIAPGDRRRSWTPEIAQGAAWVALAIVAGVLGNRADAALMRLVRRFQVEAESERVASGRDGDYLQDDPAQLIAQVAEFYRRFPGLPDHVREAVAEELATQIAAPKLRRAVEEFEARRGSNARKPPIEPLPAEDHERIRAITLLELVAVLREPSSELVEDLWTDLPTEEID